MSSINNRQIKLPESSDILLVGLVRNGEKTLLSSIERINSSFSHFKSIKWLIIESDSEDATISILESCVNKFNNFKYITAGKIIEDIPLRTERIAFCRNIYLNEIKKNTEYSLIDFLVVADLDGINDGLTKESIDSCWLRTDWDVCTANQKYAYYDIWALRHPIISPNDCWEQYIILCKKIKSEYSLLISVISRMVEISTDSDWIEVDSAFGGLAIYRRDAIEDDYYLGLRHDTFEICEHVHFHLGMRSKKKKIFINPKLINGGFNEHTEKYQGILNSISHNNNKLI
jgi:hypothetical protein